MGYRPERNFGCIVGLLVVAPFSWVWLFGNALGGFGCEGATEPCTPRIGTFLLGVLLLIGAALVVAWLTNALTTWLRNKRS
jgi:hypothetical protein